MKNRILIWGTGARAAGYLEKQYFAQCSLVGFVDTYKKGSHFMGYPVYEPGELSAVMETVDYLIIANQFFTDVVETCIRLKLDWDKLVLTDVLLEPVFYKLFERLKPLSEVLYRELEKRPMRIVKVNETDPSDADRKTGNGRYRDLLYVRDYFRYRTFEMVAKEILEQNVPGEAAELGVFEGTFAAMINETFKEKKLYLFDTFEGFDKDEAEKEIANGHCDEGFIEVHKNPSEERLRHNMPAFGRCRICKGYFPDCVSQEAKTEKYAFVSLDVDFEESTYQGLVFFYPRLSEGGVIFLHDYHALHLEGVKKAVERFEHNFKCRLKKVPLADRAGTLVIVK